jgi:hypothetical protein
MISKPSEKWIYRNEERGMGEVSKNDETAVTPLHWIERKRIEEVRLKSAVHEQKPPFKGLTMSTVAINCITSAQ